MSPLKCADMLIHTNVDLDKDTRCRVLVEYEERVRSITGPTSAETGYAQFNRWHGRTIEALGSSGCKWKRELAARCIVLLSLLQDADDGRVILSITARAHIMAALQYVFDHDDVIRDSTLVYGFADDALVVNQCLTVLFRRDARLLATYFGSMGAK